MQVIKFKNGTAQTLLDSGPVDLSTLGAISVHRSSEILFDEAVQKFYIHFLEPALSYLNETIRLSFYPTYKAAVEEEVKLINAFRKSGLL